MGIYDNVIVDLNQIESKTKDNDKIAKEILIDAALWDEVHQELDKPGMSLSGGQKQQGLFITRALAMHPEILLMDKPVSALDHRASSKIKNI